jgi:hypothetical protein
VLYLLTCLPQFELRINAVVAVACGIVIVNVVELDLSEPKSSTAIARFDLLELYIKAHLAVNAEVQEILLNPTYAV